MKFENISLKNYRQYRDAKISFPPIEEGTFVIIEGANGAGKTNFLNAITWCLYGTEIHLDEDYKGLPIVNTSTIGELEEGEQCKVEVEIQMEGESGEKVVVKRSAKFRKTESERVEKVRTSNADRSDGFSFEILRLKPGDTDWVAVRNPELVLQRIIPESIKEYFFFDGERLNEYFRSSNEDIVRKEVKKISQLDLLEKSIKHLDRRRDKFLKKSEDLSPEVEQLREERESLKNELETSNKNLEELNEKRREFQRKEKEYREKIKSSSVENVGQLEERREKLEQRLEDLQQEEEKVREDKKEYLLSIAPGMLSQEAVKIALEKINEREEAGDIPPDFKKNFLERLLDEGKCICGSDLNENAELRRTLRARLEETDDISDISEEVMRESANLNSILEKLRKFEKNRKEINTQLKEIEKERKKKSRDVREIEEQIKGVNAEKVQRWEAKAEDFSQKKRNIDEEIGKVKEWINNKKDKLDDIETEIDKKLSEKEEHKELKNIISFCKESLSVLEETKNEIMEENRREVEKKTENQFFELIWNPETFTDVSIDENYNISVTHKSGFEAIGTLSAGQRQALALSFLSALNESSGFNVPIVIDTPLGRISSEPRENIAENLPNYLEGKQVTMLVTDEEYTEKVRNRLTPRVGKEYKIDFTGLAEGGVAELVPYE